MAGPEGQPGCLAGTWRRGEEGSVQRGESEGRRAEGPGWPEPRERDGGAGGGCCPSGRPGVSTVPAGSQRGTGPHLHGPGVPPRPPPCSVLRGLSRCRRRGRGAPSSCRWWLPLVRGAGGTVYGSCRLGLAGGRPGRWRGVAAVAACRLGGEWRWDGGGSAGCPSHPSWPGFGAGCVLGGCRGRSHAPGLGHGWQRRHGSGWSWALAWKESWGGMEPPPLGSLPGAGGAAVLAVGQAGSAGRLTDKLTLAGLPYWRPKCMTAFGGFSHPSQGAVSFDTSLWGVFTPTLEDWPHPPLQSHLGWGWSTRNEGPDPGHAIPARGPSSHLVAGTSPAPFLMGNSGMKANQRKWRWGVSSPKHGAAWGTLTFAGSIVGRLRSWWPCGFVRWSGHHRGCWWGPGLGVFWGAVQRIGQVRLWLGRRSWLRGTSHPSGKDTVHGIGWDEGRTCPDRLTPLHPVEWSCWPEGARGTALPPGRPHQVHSLWAT